MVGEAVGEWGAVVEGELVVGRSGIYRGLEGAFGGPALQDPCLEGREVGLPHLRVGIWGGRLAGHDRQQGIGAVTVGW